MLTDYSPEERFYQAALLDSSGGVPSRSVSAPVLLLGFNRPDRLHDLIASLRASAPPIVRIAVDGPRSNRPGERNLVAECLRAVELVDWTDDVEVLERASNMGLERAIPDAVSWVLSSHESVIVIEDDVIIGDQFIDFAQCMLSRFAADNRIMHVSGYNVVPSEALSNPSSSIRLSRVPESLAWATWRRAWQSYEPDLSWTRSCPHNEMANLVGSRLVASRWRQNFALADRRLISTWAYRWIASMWAQDGWCISPNRNLVSYRGYDAGTHTRRRAKWLELPIEHLSYQLDSGTPVVDERGERYLHRTVFSATGIGVALGPIERMALTAIRRRS